MKNKILEISKLVKKSELIIKNQFKTRKEIAEILKKEGLSDLTKEELKKLIEMGARIYDYKRYEDLIDEEMYLMSLKNSIYNLQYISRENQTEKIQNYILETKDFSIIKELAFENLSVKQLLFLKSFINIEKLMKTINEKLIIAYGEQLTENIYRKIKKIYLKIISEDKANIKYISHIYSRDKDIIESIEKENYKTLKEIPKTFQTNRIIEQIINENNILEEAKWMDENICTKEHFEMILLKMEESIGEKYYIAKVLERNKEYFKGFPTRFLKKVIKNNYGIVNKKLLKEMILSRKTAKEVRELIDDKKICEGILTDLIELEGINSYISMTRIRNNNEKDIKIVEIIQEVMKKNIDKKIFDNVIEGIISSNKVEVSKELKGFIKEELLKIDYKDEKYMRGKFIKEYGADFLKIPKEEQTKSLLKYCMNETLHKLTYEIIVENWDKINMDLIDEEILSYMLKNSYINDKQKDFYFELYSKKKELFKSENINIKLSKIPRLYKLIDTKFLNNDRVIYNMLLSNQNDINKVADFLENLKEAKKSNRKNVQKK